MIGDYETGRSTKLDPVENLVDPIAPAGIHEEIDLPAGISVAPDELLLSFVVQRLHEQEGDQLTEAFFRIAVQFRFSLVGEMFRNPGMAVLMCAGGLEPPQWQPGHQGNPELKQIMVGLGLGHSPNVRAMRIVAEQLE